MLCGRNKSSDDQEESIHEHQHGKASIFLWSQKVQLPLCSKMYCSCCVAIVCAARLQVIDFQRTITISRDNHSQNPITSTSRSTDPGRQHIWIHYTGHPCFASSPEPISAFLLRPELLFASPSRPHASQITPCVHQATKSSYETYSPSEPSLQCIIYSSWGRVRRSAQIQSHNHSPPLLVAKSLPPRLPSCH